MAEAAKASPKAAPKAGAPAKPPFEITEERARCSNYDPKRQALFGTTHLHTGLSFDASIRFVDYQNGNNPRGAYAFAKGNTPIPIPEPSGLQPKAPFKCNDPAAQPIGGGPSRTPCIDDPLDWGAVTDHSEHFGVMGFCKNFLGDVPEKLSMECRMINGFFYEPLRAINPVFGRTLASNAFTQLTVTELGPVSHATTLPVCVNNPEACAESEMEVWNEIQNAAEEAYDRSSDCNFTSFIAYENTSTPALNNWHRNVIFRNDRVVKKPVNALDMTVRVNEDPQAHPDRKHPGGGARFRRRRAHPLVAGAAQDPGHPPAAPALLEQARRRLHQRQKRHRRQSQALRLHHHPAQLEPRRRQRPHPADVPRSRTTPKTPSATSRWSRWSRSTRTRARRNAATTRATWPAPAPSTSSAPSRSSTARPSRRPRASAPRGDTGPAEPNTWGPRSYVRNVWKDGIGYRRHRHSSTASTPSRWAWSPLPTRTPA